MDSMIELLLVLCTIIHMVEGFSCWSPAKNAVASRGLGCHFPHLCGKSLRRNCLALKAGRESSDGSLSTIKSFQYDGWNLTYQYKPATKGCENENPLMLIHPIGIGLSSWFWNRFMDTWEGSELVAIDLIGCGLHHGADAWDPDVRGLSVPLGWVKACEALMQIVSAERVNKEAKIKNYFSILASITGGDRRWEGQYSVMVQGGLAPVGVLLAARNPNLVNKLILTSPPSWSKMTTGLNETELGNNYAFFRSAFPGEPLFKLLETKWAIRYFSNLFLFAEPCDETWLDEALLEACEQARPPIQIFNAGFCFHRSYEEELRSLRQPTLILHGNADKSRIPERLDYSKEMQNCMLKELDGKNVLPWESPSSTVSAVSKFLREIAP